MTFELTDDELALLTPEELAGLKDGGDDGNEEEEQNNLTDEELAAQEQAAAAAAGAGDADADAAAKANQAAADAAAAAKALEDEQAQQPAQFKAGDVPLIRPGQTDDAEARTKELESKLDELAQQFEDGEITTPEFLKQQRLVQSDLNRLEMQQFRTELSNETTQARAEQTWYQSVETFLNGNPEIGKSQLRLQSYDAVLRGVTADEANAGKSDVEMLTIARDRWAAELGIDLKPAPKTEPVQQPAKKSGQDRPPAPNLGDVPAAQAAALDDGKFSHLDRLANSDPVAFEEALAAMSSEQRDQYLEFGA